MDRQKLAKQYSCASHTGRRLVEAITEGVDDPVLSIRVQVGVHRQTENMSREMLRIGCAARRDRILSISGLRSEEHTSELQSLMRISYAVFCLKNKNNKRRH